MRVYVSSTIQSVCALWIWRVFDCVLCCVLWWFHFIMRCRGPLLKDLWFFDYQVDAISELILFLVHFELWRDFPCPHFFPINCQWRSKVFVLLLICFSYVHKKLLPQMQESRYLAVFVMSEEKVENEFNRHVGSGAAVFTCWFGLL